MHFTGMSHIAAEHAPYSRKHQGKSRFSHLFWEYIAEHIAYCVKYGTKEKQRNKRYKFRIEYPRNIGQNKRGKPLKTLVVIAKFSFTSWEWNIITSYPA